jgi:hypothetical protein
MPIGPRIASWTRASGEICVKSAIFWPSWPALRNLELDVSFPPMKPALLVLFAVILTGCSIHPKKQLAAVRAAGVASETERHLAENSPLTPTDIIELKRRGVSDELTILHLDRVGLDYELKKEDAERLRAAKVSERVRDAAMRASARYVYWTTNAPRVVYSDPYPFYDPYFYGFGFGYTQVRRHYVRCR